MGREADRLGCLRGDLGSFLISPDPRDSEAEKMSTFESEEMSNNTDREGRESDVRSDSLNCREINCPLLNLFSIS
jgi:hypothetical protein